MQGARRGRAESQRSDKTTQPRSLRKDGIPVDLYAKIKVSVWVYFFFFFSSHCSPGGNSKERASLGFLWERSPQEFTNLVNVAGQ